MATTAAEHAQSLAEFRDHAAETLDRVNRTGEPEMIVVDGEVRGVLVPPGLYREIQLARDVAAIRRSDEDIEAGRVQPLAEVSREVRAMLLARQAAEAAK